MHLLDTDVTGVILVGGQSRRMGVDKAFLEIEGIPLFERVLEVFRQTFARIILVGGPAGSYAGYGLPRHPDIYSGSALGGLYTGLVQADTPYIFASACDIPFPSGAVIRHLVALRKGFDAVVPTGEKGYEPLFAVYSVNCREPMRDFLERGNFRIFDLYAGLAVNYAPLHDLSRLDGGTRSFVNLNTPEEYARYAGKTPKGK